jgi:hypothetical protein
VICIVLGLLYVVCHISLIIISQVQEYSLAVFDVWNITVGSIAMFTGLLFTYAVVMNRRGLLMLTAVLGLLIVNLYATWITSVMNTQGRLAENCEDPTYFGQFTTCKDLGWITAELAFNWLNWGLSILVIWGSSYLSEQLQNYERAEELGIDRNLSDPFTLCGRRIRSPINLSRGIMLLMYVLLFVVAAVMIVLGCIIDSGGGYPRALYFAPRNDLMFLVPYLYVAIATGLIGIAVKSRRWLIASLVWLVWCMQYSFGLGFSSCFLLADGYQVDGAIFNPVLPLTGWLRTAIYAATFFALFCCSVCILGGMVIWILNEAMQDQVLFAAQHGVEKGGPGMHVGYPDMSDSYLFPTVSPTYANVLPTYQAPTLGAQPMYYTVAH